MSLNYSRWQLIYVKHTALTKPRQWEMHGNQFRTLQICWFLIEIKAINNGTLRLNRIFCSLSDWFPNVASHIKLTRMFRWDSFGTVVLCFASVFRRNVLWYGAVRLFVTPSLRTSVNCVCNILHNYFILRHKEWCGMYADRIETHIEYSTNIRIMTPMTYFPF